MPSRATTQTSIEDDDSVTYTFWDEDHRKNAFLPVPRRLVPRRPFERGARAATAIARAAGLGL